jgi:dTDP-4-amino-4,6-dideoxygalactose transaminase
MSIPDTARHAAREVVFESHPVLGYNYRMTDIQAAVGREQLKRLPEIIKRRRVLGQRYLELLAPIQRLGKPKEPSWARSNWQSFCVRLPDQCDQRTVMQKMLDAGIATRRAVMCAHREPAYGQDSWRCGFSLNGSGCAPPICIHLRLGEQAQDHGIILPLFHQMTYEEQDMVVRALQEACAL